MFTIDGITWNFPCDITRVAEMTASDISGLMLDKSYFNDVIGTYMSYTIKIAVPTNKMENYANLYEAITAPKDGHTMKLPYNRGTINITARITDISDVYVKMADGKTYWKGIQFTAVSNYPSKSMSAGEVITAGRTKAPSIYNPKVGDTYTYTANGWVLVD